ncbi:MAG: thiopurine S-methyltransferase [Pseudomonadota bacterium]
MEEAFWQSRWRDNNIGFHEDRSNALLLAHFKQLGLGSGDTVFVPLCGKSVDLDWLRGNGLHVKGIEFNEGAVRSVFARNALDPDVSKVGDLKLYASDALKIFVGDLFALNADMLGYVSAIYDRAALVALPGETRSQYAAHIRGLTERAPQLIVSYDYDQSQTEGPPFSVPFDDVQQLYNDHYTGELLSSLPISGPLAQRCDGKEYASLLTPR